MNFLLSHLNIYPRNEVKCFTNWHHITLKLRLIKEFSSIKKSVLTLIDVLQCSTLSFCPLQIRTELYQALLPTLQHWDCNQPDLTSIGRKSNNVIIWNSNHLYKTIQPQIPIFQFLINTNETNLSQKRSSNNLKALFSLLKLLMEQSSNLQLYLSFHAINTCHVVMSRMKCSNMKTFILYFLSQ